MFFSAQGENEESSKTNLDDFISNFYVDEPLPRTVDKVNSTIA